MLAFLHGQLRLQQKMLANSDMLLNFQDLGLLAQRTITHH